MSPDVQRTTTARKYNIFISIYIFTTLLTVIFNICLFGGISQSILLTNKAGILFGIVTTFFAVYFLFKYHYDEKFPTSKINLIGFIAMTFIIATVVPFLALSSASSAFK